LLRHAIDLRFTARTACGHEEEVEKRRTVVATIASPQEQACLQRILKVPNWNVEVVQSLRTLSATVEKRLCRVVLTGTQLPDGHNWRDVLDNLDRLTNRPQLIVVDRLANEALWAEVLNLGAYDLLMTPFEPAEVQRVLSLAWEFHFRETARKHDRAARETLAGSSKTVIRAFAVSA
jgi:DNA-binding NtrC family response regulator